MPIDKMMLDPMLTPFKNMVEDCKSKNISGEHFDNLVTAYNRLEQLGQEHDDYNAFNAAVMNEGIYTNISDYYLRALSAQANEELNSDDSNYSDENLLKLVLDALRNSISELKRSYEEAIKLAGSHDPNAEQQMGLDYMQRTGAVSASDAEKMKKQGEKNIEETLKKKPAAFDSSVEVEVLSNPEKIIKPIQALIDLGEEPGMTLPNFLRIQIEKGLDKAAEGTAVQRDGQEYLMNFAQAMMVSPLHIEKERRKLKAFDDMAAKNKFNVPNTRELSLVNDDIDRELEPQIKKWDKIKRYWENLLWDLDFWSLAYCSFAPFIEPWSMAPNPKQACIDTQKMRPGVFKEREKLFQKYFGLSFHDIFNHETFLWEIKSNYLGYSQEYIEFLVLEVYDHCKPFNDLPQEIITKRGNFSMFGPNKIDREMNPEIHLPNRRLQAYYDSYFGEGRYASKYDIAPVPKTAAAPWNLDTFKLK
ncbi:MAG: hypothetical protein JXR53_04860 [Bacteroidales bacterium]|nr:hypothetical protein [Bacteroidales bacterium]